jgi:hypothetical protein
MSTKNTLATLVVLNLLGCSSNPDPKAGSQSNQNAGSESGGSYTTDTGGSPSYSGASGGGYASGSGGSSGSSGSDNGSGSGGVGNDGSGGTAGDGSSGDGSNTASGYTNLAPPMLDALDPNGGTTLSPPPPTGWNWYPIADTQCRDGSPTGVYVRFGSVPKLLIYLEGGGACTDAGFCNYNPPNINMAIVGTGETVLGSAAGLVASRQQPGVYTGGTPQGIFDDSNDANPYKGWSEVYVPYCTGDVHFGSKPNATVTGVTATQQFVGYSNMQKIVGHLVPTFASKVERFVLTGASAGSFGAALNFSMVQDAFGSVPGAVIMDAGLPFSDKYMFACMQKFWRDTWGMDASLPSDCKECFDSDGGGLVHLADFLMKKHPNAKLAAISATQDEVMRLFFSMGLKSCAAITTADPVGITLGQLDPTVYYPGADYSAAIDEMKSTYVPSGRLATYTIGGADITLHQHTFRTRFYDAVSGGKTIAAFVSDFLGGDIEQVVP